MEALRGNLEPRERERSNRLAMNKHLWRDSWASRGRPEGIRAGPHQCWGAWSGHGSSWRRGKGLATKGHGGGGGVLG